ncbi:uncharacterized protein LOC118477145, partial [Aplysia californica]|uniref:Uncharacterized protein LOC118477145 n=1 Tax=Aplysia californica TaxID=6500 RepID=A0ABM1VQH7_APLCA
MCAYKLLHFLNRCTDYQDIPNGCTVQKLAGQCCPQIVCQGNQVIVPSTTNVLSQGSGDSVYKDTATGGSKPLLPQVRPDGTIDPNNSGVQLPSITGCLYSGRLLVQGETGMDDQCGDVCECIDATKGSMSCTQRCPIYQNV